MSELNHADKWVPVPEMGSLLHGEGVTARIVQSPRRVLVSGDLAAFAQVCSAPSLRLARDRTLVVGEVDLASGWHEAGFAVSDLTAGLALVELSGPGVVHLSAKATTTDLTNPGPSKAVTFAGMPVVLAMQAETLGLHVERGLLAYLWTWLAAALQERSA